MLRSLTRRKLLRSAALATPALILPSRKLLARSMHGTGGGGGGDIPAWVPANAKIYIEPRILNGFATGRAWTEADGIVDVDTLLGADANTSNAWADTGYNPAKLTVDGYVRWPDNPFAFIGAARTMLTAGATVRTQFKQIQSSYTNTAVAFVAADGNDAIQWILRSVRQLECDSFSGSLSANINNIVNLGAGALNALAFTLVIGRVDNAANGSAVTSGVPDATDRPPGNPLVAWLVDGADQAVQSITIYDALPSTAGLTELSVTA